MKAPELRISPDGVEYKTPGSPVVHVKWAEIQSVDYVWGPWYEDVWGYFPRCSWSFAIVGSRATIQIEDNKLNSSILLAAMRSKLPGFTGDLEALRKLARGEEFADGAFRCWPGNV